MHALVLRSCLALLLAAPPDSDPPTGPPTDPPSDPPPVQRPSTSKPVPRKVNPTAKPTPTPAPTPAPTPDPAPPPDGAPPPDAGAPAPAPAPDPTTEPTPPPGPDAGTPAPAPAPTDAGVPPPDPITAPFGDPTATPGPGPAPADAGLPPPSVPVDSRPGPPGTGMIFGGISLAGPGLVIASIGLIGFVITEPGGPPLGQIMMGTGGAMLVGGGVLAGFGFKRNIEFERWIKATGVKPPRSGHGLLVAGGLAAGTGISIIAWQADVARRSPRGETCTAETGCTNPRGEAAIGIAVGVLALGGAGALLGIGIKRKQKYDAWMRMPVTPSFSLLPGGGGLTLSGRF